MIVTIFAICHQLLLAWLTRKSNTMQWIQTIFDLVSSLTCLQCLWPWGRAGPYQTHPSRHQEPKPGAQRGATALHFQLAFSNSHPTSSRVSSYSWFISNKSQFLSFPSASSNGESKETEGREPSPPWPPGLSGANRESTVSSEQWHFTPICSTVLKSKLTVKIIESNSLYCKNRNILK